MPLTIIKRGKKWHARGRIEYRGKAISNYYRQSTGSSEESSAWQWCRKEEERVIDIHILGHDSNQSVVTFSDAVLQYDAKQKEAKYLLPITKIIGQTPISKLSPKTVRELGPQLYPNASTDTWTRQVVTPVRAVINNLHDRDSGNAFRVRTYSKLEKQAQNKRRGSAGRKKHPPGDWQWLLRFREHASQRQAAFALLMFATAGRVSQITKMHPDDHVDVANCKVCIPEAKGHEDRWIEVPPEVLAELLELPRLHPKGQDRTTKNLRLFGWASRSGPRSGWNTACKKAGISQIPFHSAGRHGYGQEMNVRQMVDAKAAAEFGGWSDINLMRKTYTHAEDTDMKVIKALRRGLKKAERATNLKLKKET